MEHRCTLLYLAHMNWDHVWQRPQQLMTRFATRCRVIYCDPAEIDHAATVPHLAERPSCDGVRVMRPIFPASILDTPGNNYRELWLRLLPALLAEAGPDTILWVSSPLSDYLVAAARSHVRLAVYDCMDDLSSFRGGDDQTRQRERRLLELVDLLFTGGPSLYARRKHLHPRAYCFPSGVDLAHYQTVAESSLPIPAPVGWIPSPRLGYIGVLDERVDWPLIAEIAHERPRWHWVLVGPIAKVHPRELPGAPNIHYVGQQPYADLPAYLKSFAVATMPFALNAATRSISPTKTLEYLAGGKPVISSSVPDVVAGYRGVVEIVDGPVAWIARIEQLLDETPEQQVVRRERALPLLEQASWDAIAGRMWTLMTGH
jgi:UDP-galactopyranose mutase